jgi:hypothetical protein
VTENEVGEEKTEIDGQNKETPKRHIELSAVFNQLSRQLGTPNTETDDELDYHYH